jgi:hypothetical protein
MSVSVVEIPVTELKVLDINPRSITKDALLKLKKSILEDSEFLRLRPILANRVNNQLSIYAGAQRYRACVELGYTTVPCIISDNLSESQLKERMLKDNTHYGQWDIAKLDELDISVLRELDLSDLQTDTQTLSKPGRANPFKGRPQESVYNYRVVLPSKADKDDLLSAILVAKESLDLSSTEELFLLNK